MPLICKRRITAHLPLIWPHALSVRATICPFVVISVVCFRRSSDWASDLRQVFSALLPYRVLGDGNCCLHAISVAMWGIQDRVGVLRRAMHGMMMSKDLFWNLRWKQQETEWDAVDAVSAAFSSDPCRTLCILHAREPASPPATAAASDKCGSLIMYCTPHRDAMFLIHALMRCF